MRPVAVRIVGRSRGLIPQLQHKLADAYELLPIVAHLDEDGTIILSHRVTTRADIEPLKVFLRQAGVTERDIRIDSTAISGQDQLARALSRGVRDSGLDFGQDVAERDAALERYFVETPSYRALLHNNKHVVIGPKGIGKTALLRKVMAEQRNSILITPESYATDVLEALSAAPVMSDRGALTTTWKYTLLIEIFRQVVGRRLGDERTSKLLKAYLLDHGLLHTQLSLFDQFIEYVRRIVTVKGKIGPVEGEIGLDRATELRSLLRLDALFDLTTALQQALRRDVFTIYIDELDQGWNNSDIANRFLVALLTAAIQMRGYSSNLHVVVFLRSEIFELLTPHLDQLDKLRSDIEAVTWSDQNLTTLIVRRALHSLRIFENVHPEAGIQLLFPGTVAPSGTPTFDYLLKRTSYRPREVIQFANLAVAAASALDARAISGDAVLRAEDQFSEWKFEHIVSANLHIYPRLQELLNHFRGVPRRVDHSWLEQRLSDALLSVAEEATPPSWFNSDLDVTTLIRLLFELEVIGSERVDHAGYWMKDDYEFVYERPKARPELSQTFMFHPGLWKALDLVELRGAA